MNSHGKDCKKKSGKIVAKTFHNVENNLRVALREYGNEKFKAGSVNSKDELNKTYPN